MTNLTLRLNAVTYIAGTVNGVPAIFTQDSYNPSQWLAEVETAPDNIYDISLEIHSESGDISYYDVKIKYQEISFVTDRTQSDVDYAKILLNKSLDEMTEDEKNDYVFGLKGCMNTKDYERIENAISKIAGMANIIVHTFDGNIPVIINDSYIMHMLSNVQTLRNIGYRRRNTPNIPTYPIVNYQQWNDIETILRDVYECLNERDYYYCGEMYMGEIGII